ncbi:MAG: hypothetical protein QNJ71_07230 [Acidimicrobiia bacterium]|nr:hypothetical protein [Acidimicrobiia bacterium]
MGPTDAHLDPRHVGRQHEMVGHARLRRVGWWSYPVHELTQNGEPLARLGRGGWFTINFGRGQTIALASGYDWKVTSRSGGGTFYPVIVDSVGRPVTIGGVSNGTYGINGRDYSYVLYPKDKHRVGKADHWVLRHHEQVIAELTRYPASIDAAVPVHLGAVIMAFVLIRHGLPDESMPRIPALRWSQHR